MIILSDLVVKLRELGITQDSGLLPSQLLPSMYTVGMVLSVSSLTQLFVSSGAARDNTDAFNIFLNSGQVITSSTVGAGGIDAGTIAANTQYYIYAIGGTAGNSAIISTNATTPVYPPGYSYRSSRGTIMTNASAQFIDANLIDLRNFMNRFNPSFKGTLTGVSVAVTNVTANNGSFGNLDAVAASGDIASISSDNEFEGYNVFQAINAEGHFTEIKDVGTPVIPGVISASIIANGIVYLNTSDPGTTETFDTAFNIYQALGGNRPIGTARSVKIINNGPQDITLAPTLGDNFLLNGMPSTVIKAGQTFDIELLFTGISPPFIIAYGGTNLSAYALDANVVHKTGNETIAGLKIFSDDLEISAGKTLYVDSIAGESSSLRLNPFASGQTIYVGHDMASTVVVIGEGSTASDFTLKNTTNTNFRVQNSGLVTTRSNTLDDGVGRTILGSSSIKSGGMLLDNGQPSGIITTSGTLTPAQIISKTIVVNSATPISLDWGTAASLVAALINPQVGSKLDLKVVNIGTAQVTLTNIADPSHIGTLGLIGGNASVIPSADTGEISIYVTNVSTPALALFGGTSSDITLVRTTGATMTGNLIFSSGSTATGLPNPINASDAASKAYVDMLITGFSAKAPVNAATTTNITLSGAQTIDGYAVTAGMRVLVKNQSTSSQNGIYDTFAGAWNRSPDGDTPAELNSAYVFVKNGSTQSGTGWLQTATIVTLDVDPVNFVQFSGQGTYTDGAGITLTGNSFSITPSGVAIGTYNTVTVNVLGQVTAGSNTAYGTVNSFAFTNANGFSGSVSNPTTSPALTLATSVTGVLKGDTGALTAAISGTDYAPGTSALATGLLKSTTGTGALTIATGADIPNISESQVTNLVSDLAAKANDSAVVHNTGNETIGGTKTFSNTIQGSISGNAATVTTNATITFMGDATGSGANAVNLTLATTGVVAGSYNNIVVNSKGLAIGGSNIAYLTANQNITLSGDISGSGTTAITATLPNIVTAGSSAKPSYNAKGQITGSGSLNSTDVTTGLGYTPVNKAGDTMSGTLTFSAGTVTGLATPSAASDAVTKAYVDNAITGQSWKTAVKAATTGNITLSGAQTIDGIALVASDRVLVKNQSTTSQNGIYVVASGAWTRSLDADTAAELDGAAVYVQEGSTQQDTGWTETATITTIGTDPVIFAQFAGAGAYSAGAGLTLTGTTFSIANGAITNAMLAGSIAFSKLVGTDIVITESQVTNLVSDLAGKAGLATANTFTNTNLFNQNVTIAATKSLVTDDIVGNTGSLKFNPAASGQTIYVGHDLASTIVGVGEGSTSASFYVRNAASVKFMVANSGAVTTLNNTLDNGSGGATFTGLITGSISGNAATVTTNATTTFTGDATGSGQNSVALTLANSGVTAGTYNGNLTVDAKGRVTAAASMSNSAVTRTVQTVRNAANGYQISATRDAWAVYTVNVSATANGGATSTIILWFEICPTNSAVPGDWIQVSKISQTVTAGALGAAVTNSQLQVLSGFIPKTFFARIVVQTNTGTTSQTYDTGQETLI